MKVRTYSEARQRLASLLDQSRREGKVQIRRRDGQLLFCSRLGHRSRLWMSQGSRAGYGEASS